MKTMGFIGQLCHHVWKSTFKRYNYNNNQKLSYFTVNVFKISDFMFSWRKKKSPSAQICFLFSVKCNNNKEHSGALVFGQRGSFSFLL